MQSVAESLRFAAQVEAATEKCTSKWLHETETAIRRERTRTKELAVLLNDETAATYHMAGYYQNVHPQKTMFPDRAMEAAFKKWKTENTELLTIVPERWER